MTFKENPRIPACLNSSLILAAFLSLCCNLPFPPHSPPPLQPTPTLMTTNPAPGNPPPFFLPPYSPRPDDDSIGTSQTGNPEPSQQFPPGPPHLPRPLSPPSPYPSSAPPARKGIFSVPPQTGTPERALHTLPPISPPHKPGPPPPPRQNQNKILSTPPTPTPRAKE